jgi:hypothetical protein
MKTGPDDLGTAENESGSTKHEDIMVVTRISNPKNNLLVVTIDKTKIIQWSLYPPNVSKFSRWN